MRESRIEKYLRQQCREAGYECLKFKSPGRRAVFDRVVRLPQGKTLWIEVKRPGKRLTQAQQREQLRLEDLGHRAEWVNSIKTVDWLVEKFLC
jgi:hypothetical protein